MRSSRAGIIAGIIFASLATLAHAQSADDLRAQIADHSSQIDKLNQEIAQYEKQLTEVGTKKKTLQTAISTLNLNIKKTTASINVTKNQIGSTQAEIQGLASDIRGKETTIDAQKAAIAQTLRNISASDDRSMLVQMLSEETLSDTWREIDESDALQRSISAHIAEIAQQKAQLTDTKAKTEAKKAELEKQKDTLLSQQGSLNAQKASQNDLLAQTKSQEATYQKILKEKKAQEAAFEDALTDLKAKLEVAINPSSITPAGKGVLHWPVDNVRVTQYFGNTAFAASGAYNGKGHNGIDLAAPIGTPLKAALSGTVIGTGNTDAVKGCYSFGKWVMVKHSNGLNTMYAHLSQIAVATGDQVSTGQLVGYSGETGYATGPHLHFGVYVSSATQILRLGDATNSKTPCANATMPITPLAGYLNPMSYL